MPGPYFSYCDRRVTIRRPDRGLTDGLLQYIVITTYFLIDRTGRHLIHSSRVRKFLELHRIHLTNISAGKHHSRR